MPVLLQINTVANTGSTGRIAEGIGQAAMNAGWRSYIAFGRSANNSQSELIKIGTNWDILNHGLQTRLFDRHGLASKKATKIFIEKIKKIKPDIIHLHNIHGYYLNYPILFKFLSEINIPVIWTLHDCWPFTGHCVYFSYLNCQKWKVRCEQCANKKDYPSSYCFDNSYNNYLLKEEYFNSVSKLILIPVSNWLKGLLHLSFLNNVPSKLIYNGIDLVAFHPHEEFLELSFNSTNSDFVLGVANIWTRRKGLQDFIKLRDLLPDTVKIVLLGLSQRQINELPEGIIGLQRTENVNQLSQFYAASLAFVNLTWEDNFPTTNLEALACGTPVITYRTGGSPEAISSDTGFIVEQGDLEGVVNAIKDISGKGKSYYTAACRERAIRFFNKEERFQEYVDLYNRIMSNKIAYWNT